MTRTYHRPYSDLVGLSGLEAYAVDAAVLRWGTAFQSALDASGQGAKTPEQAQARAEQVLRRWVPSTRRYR